MKYRIEGQASVDRGGWYDVVLTVEAHGAFRRSEPGSRREKVRAGWEVKRHVADRSTAGDPSRVRVRRIEVVHL